MATGQYVVVAADEATVGQSVGRIALFNEDGSPWQPGGGGPAVVAWSDVTGKPSTFPPAAHTHDVDDVDGLQSSLDGKAAVSHTHTVAQVTGLQDELDGKQPAGSYAAASHTHTVAQVTGLQSELDGKADTGDIVIAGVIDEGDTPPAPGIYVVRPV